MLFANAKASNQKRFTSKNMRPMQQTIYLEKEVGESLGRSKIL